MSFDDDDRYDRFLQYLRYLSLVKHTGLYPLIMNDGRISYSTMKQLNDAVGAIREQRHAQTREKANA